MVKDTEIVITPTQTESWVRDALLSCQKEFVVVSPFVTEHFTQMLGEAPEQVHGQLFTRTSIKGFAAGASNLSAVETIAKSGVTVSILPRLHAKIYIFDSSLALVTSANATRGGMRGNLECGVALCDPVLVQELTKTVQNGFGIYDTPRQVTAEYLQGLQPLVDRYRESMKEAPPIGASTVEETAIIMDEHSQTGMLESLGGWTALTLEGVFSIKKQSFELDEVYRACKPLATTRYPDNYNVEAKVRQQLQILRDLEFIEFLGGGSYRCLIETRKPN